MMELILIMQLYWQLPDMEPERINGFYIYAAPIDDLQDLRWKGFTVKTDNTWTLPDDWADYCWKVETVENDNGQWLKARSGFDQGCQERAGCHQ